MTPRPTLPDTGAQTIALSPVDVIKQHALTESTDHSARCLCGAIFAGGDARLAWSVHLAEILGVAE